MTITDELSADNGHGSNLGIVARPQFQLRSLPVQCRWEATRRHPFYLDCWKDARAHHDNDPTQHDAKPFLRQAAVVVLGAIGVSGRPLDPATDFEDIESPGLNAAWLSGAVHPISMGGLVGLLIAALPKETLRNVGQKLLDAGRDDEDGEFSKINAMIELCALDAPGLDCYPDEPIVSVNPSASGRQIETAVSELLAQWKQERGLSEQRDRTDKYADYLRVWDLREGWRRGAYDRMQERNLQNVAAELRCSVTTVHNRYRRAFELIVGHPYSPEMWLRVFGPTKLSDLYGPTPGSVSRRRPQRSPVRRDVPDSVVSRLGDDDSATGVVGAGAVSSDSGDCCELVSDIRSLLSRGRTDQQIADELELSDAAIAAIAYLRERGDDL